MKSIAFYPMTMLLLVSLITIIAQDEKIERLKSEKEDYPNIVLPEEYKALTQEDHIYGWYANDTLYIDYDNQAYYTNVQ